MPVIRRCAKAATVDGERYHALEEPTSLNTTELLPELMAANIASVKIEGRQRSPAYVTRGESLAPGDRSLPSRSAEFRTAVRPMETPGAMSEGTQTTLGAYHRKWQ